MSAISVKNILVIVDPTATSHPAIAKASVLAQHFGSRLELFVCDYRSGLEAPSAAGARATLVAHRYEFLESLAAPLRKAGITVAVDACFASPLHEAILRKVRSSHADLIVKDTHYHSLMRRTLVTNTDWHLLRGCPVPLLLVKPAQWNQKLCTLAAIDPGHHADVPAALDSHICEWSVLLANALHGAAHAVHIYFPNALLLSSVAGNLPLTVSVGMETQLIEEERRARLEKVQAITLPVGIKAEHLHLELGTPSGLLAEAAERLHADILVMGAVSRSGLKRLFIGSTAEHTLDHIPCDLLVLKPLDFGPDLPF
jgi:universal stress protein E